MDAVIVLVAALLVVGLTYWAGLTYMGHFLVTLVLALAVWEAIAYFRARGQGKKDRTISQRFGKLLRERPALGYTLLAVYALGCAGLLVHLWAMRN